MKEYEDSFYYFQVDIE